jgi:hypothetical protein
MKQTELHLSESDRLGLDAFRSKGVCAGERSRQLLRQTRAPIAGQPGQCVDEDYEYRRAGPRNLFVAVESSGRRRAARRIKVDFVAFVGNLLQTVYATALTVHLVLDNLNTHFRQTFGDVMGETTVSEMLQRVQFHDTP